MRAVLLRVGETAVGPVLPAEYGLVWGLVAAVAVAVTALGLVRVIRSRELRPLARLVWVLLIVLTIPVGAIAALILVRSSRPRSA